MKTKTTMIIGLLAFACSVINLSAQTQSAPTVPRPSRNIVTTQQITQESSSLAIEPPEIL